MEINLDRREGVFVLKPVGELDAAAVRDLQEAVTLLLDEEGACSVAFDLSGTRNLGSVGIRFLMALSKKLAHRGGGLILCSLSDDMKRAFGVAGVSHRLSTTDSRDEAIRLLAAKERIARLSDQAERLLADAEERVISDENEDSSGTGNR